MPVHHTPSYDPASGVGQDGSSSAVLSQLDDRISKQPSGANCFHQAATILSTVHVISDSSEL